jgi:hypothetical protein
VILSALLTACATEPPEKEVVVQTKIVERDIPVVPRPDPVRLRDITFYTVTEENFEDFKVNFLGAGNQFVFVAISISDYEDISINLADLHRYIKQQGEIIVYYETALSE